MWKYNHSFVNALILIGTISQVSNLAHGPLVRISKKRFLRIAASVFVQEIQFWKFVFAVGCLFESKIDSSSIRASEASGRYKETNW